jgi:hypothetical protein
MGAGRLGTGALSAAFVASLVEVVEAFTIVLAVATLRGWRPAAFGTAATLLLLGLIVLVLGPLLDRVPIHLLQLVIGIRGTTRAHVSGSAMNGEIPAYRLAPSTPAFKMPAGAVFPPLCRLRER